MSFDKLTKAAFRVRDLLPKLDNKRLSTEQRACLDKALHVSSTM